MSRIDLDAQVAPLRADVERGAAEVSARAADAVRSVAEAYGRGAEDPPFPRLLEDLVVRILDAQPAMAPLVTLGREVLAAGEADRAAERVIRKADAFRTRLQQAAEAAGRQAAEVVRDARCVLTVSSSSTVRAALLHAASARPALRVITLEGRPGLEGRLLAAALAEADVETILAVDAAADALVPQADVVLFGADSLGDAGAVNKLGSVGIARAARARSLPVIVAADRTKLLPPGFPQPVDDDRPPEEVWDAPAGVRVHNRYFERIPFELVDRIVLEDGPRSPGGIDREREELRVPEVLERWARRRRG